MASSSLAPFPLSCFSSGLASTSSVSLPLIGQRGRRSAGTRREEKEAELIDVANYRPLAARCLRPQIRLKPWLISLATWLDQVGGEGGGAGGSGPAGSSHFKHQHPLRPPHTPLLLQDCFSGCVEFLLQPKIEKCSSGDGAAAGGSEVVYMCVWRIRAEAPPGLQSHPVKIRCEQRLCQKHK